MTAMRRKKMKEKVMKVEKEEGDMRGELGARKKRQRKKKVGDGGEESVRSLA